MQDIAELERRLTMALARIAEVADARAAQPVAPSPLTTAELDRLREELDEERMANAQLNERLRVQRERHDRSAADMRAEVERLTAQVDAQALAMHKMTQATVALREDLRRLREETGGDARLAEHAVMAELDAYRATRAAESAELADLVAALLPIVEAEEARAHA